MDREELNRLRVLRDRIIQDIKELRILEQREHSVEKYGQSVVHRITKTLLTEDHYQRKAALRLNIFELQRQFLTERADLEKEITKIPDPYVRLTFSLCYVDLLTMRNAATFVGGNCTAGAIQALGARYLNSQNTVEGIDSS